MSIESFDFELYSMALPGGLHDELVAHLIRGDGQEDLTFALWKPSYGSRRLSALLHTIVLPREGDRIIHGNVSFTPQYYKRVSQLAMESGSGIALLHSHLGPGWQGMSPDDIDAEHGHAGSALGQTELPLVGLTLGTDETWSGRFWIHKGKRLYESKWCDSVRVVGETLRSSFDIRQLPEPDFQEEFKRTISVWGPEAHANMARLKIGIVGLGSVGSIVAESLARMGMQRFVLIDFDEVQRHNLDRLLGATRSDLGHLKVRVAERQIKQAATGAMIEISPVECSIAEAEGYSAALDCDVIFSCVDRPRARKILNHFAYAHLVPVIDGGIGVRFDEQKRFRGVDWQLQTVGPGRPCLQCLGAFDSSDAQLEADGMLDDPSYLAGLQDNHALKRNENVFPFSANLASLEVIQFVNLVSGLYDLGVQRYHFYPGAVRVDFDRACDSSCLIYQRIATGDTMFSLMGRDFGAEAARERRNPLQLE